MLFTDTINRSKAGNMQDTTKPRRKIKNNGIISIGRITGENNKQKSIFHNKKAQLGQKKGKRRYKLVKNNILS